MIGTIYCSQEMVYYNNDYNRFHAIMVDNGVLRMDEAKQVHEMLNKDLGVNLTVVDASAQFLSRLEGVEDPEQKRKIIGNTFIHVFEEEAAKIEAIADAEEARGAAAKGPVEWLLQGTLYPDVIESISFRGPSATIKTHHNVGGLLKDMKLKLIEPLRELFKGTLCIYIFYGILILGCVSFMLFRRGPRPRPSFEHPGAFGPTPSLPRAGACYPHTRSCDTRSGEDPSACG